MFHRSPFPLSDMHPSTAHLLLPHSVSPSPSSVGQGVLLTHLKNLHLQKLFRSTVPSARLACRCRRAADAGRVEASVPLERPAIAVDPWSEDNGNNMLYTNRTPLLTPVERDADIRNHPSKKISLMEPGASDSEVYRDEFEVEVQHQETSVSSTVDEFSLETHGMTMSEDTEETAQGSKASLLEAPLDTGGRRHPSNRRQVSATGRAKGFWQIVENDTKFIKGGLKWMKEEALPSLTENMEKIVTMRMAEDPSVAQTSEPPFSPSYYPGLSGVELMMADAETVKGYVDNVRCWLAAWRIPLQSSYNPHAIAEYFRRRPHVLLFRIIQVSAVFTSAVTQLEIEKLWKSPDLDEEEFSRKRGAELIKESLIKLGPTFIKVGQSLSTRPDLVGEDVAQVLSELQDNLPPFSTYKAISIIEEELGRPMNLSFAYLSDAPVAAASFGQVYKGRTLDGQEVAVKVQRPNILHSVALDVYILRIGLAAVQKIAKRRNDLKRYADELGQGLFGELDYTQEAANAAEFQSMHSKVTFLEVPKTIKKLSSTKVLTMEWMYGDRPAEMIRIMKSPNPNEDPGLTERQHEAKCRLFSLVNKGIEISLVQLLDTGILHADPHPGNFLYTREGKMALLDFGLLCRMEKRHQLAMIASVAHIVNADWKNFVQDLADMEVLPAYVDRMSIALELEDALRDAVPQEGIPDIKFSKVLVKVLAIALRNHFKMPPYFILVLRSIASLEGLALAVDPDFKVFAASYPFVLQRLLTDSTPQLRKVLTSLILNDKKQFRWDRVVSFAAIAKQHSQKRIALEMGMELPTATVPDSALTNANPELVPLLINLISSEKGAAFRHLILEADTVSLASAFSSQKAATVRRNIAIKIADILYQHGKNYLKEHFEFEIEDSEIIEPVSSQPSVTGSHRNGLYLDTAFTNDINASVSETVDVSSLKGSQLQSLLHVLVARLRRHPLSMLSTAWHAIMMIGCAVAIAAHKLLVKSVFKYLDGEIPSMSPQLIHV